MGQTIAVRPAGNPFLAQEMVRELAERGVLAGERGTYTSAADVSEVSVPATLQATICRAHIVGIVVEPTQVREATRRRTV